MGSPPQKRLRVAHVVCTDAFAGVERYVSLLAAAQAKEGWRITVVGGSAQRMQAVLPADVRWHAGATWPSALWSLVGAGRPDVVHVHMTAAEIAGILTRPLWRAPVIATRHFARRRGTRRMTRLVSGVIGRSLAGQIAISEAVAAEADGPSRVIHTGVLDVDGPDPATRRPEVLVLQRLEQEKRTDVALAIWDKSGLGERGWRLRIAGEGCEAPKLHRQTAELGLGRSVEFLGYRDDASALLRRASVLIAPSPNEGLGLTVIEAMACALPVIAAGAKGHLETVGACERAALFDVSDASGAAAQLHSLVDDPEARAAYGAALQRVQRERFSLHRQVSETAAFYREVLAGESV